MRLRGLRVTLLALALALIAVSVTALVREGRQAEQRQRADRDRLWAQSVLIERALAAADGAGAGLQGRGLPLQIVAPGGSEGALALPDGDLPWRALAGPVEDQTGVTLYLGAPEPGDAALSLGPAISGGPVWASVPPPRIAYHWSERVGVLLILAALSLGLLMADLGVLAWGRRQAEVADRARGLLLQRISHELRTPAAGVRSLAETLESGAVTAPEDLRTFHGLVRSEAERLSEGIERLLRAARGGADRPLEREHVALDAWADAVARRWAPRLPDLRLQIAPGAPASLDRDRLDEAIDVLLDNALRYGAAPVVLSASRVGGRVEIAVQDAGPGVPEGERGRIFRLGVRGAQAATEGHGLGLWIVARIAAAHGGRARLEGGSRFVISLPG